MHVLANILIKSRLVLVIQKVLIYSLFNLIYTVNTMQLFYIWLLYFCSVPENVF